VPEEVYHKYRRSCLTHEEAIAQVRNDCARKGIEGWEPPVDTYKRREEVPAAEPAAGVADSDQTELQ
jgi:hypothetical protein